MMAVWFNQKWVHAEPGQLVCAPVPRPAVRGGQWSVRCSAPAESEEHLPLPAAVSQAALVLALHNKSLCVLPVGRL